MHKFGFRLFGCLLAILCVGALCPAVAAAQETDLVTTAAQLTAQSGNIASGEWGTCPWEIASDGTLTVHPGLGPDTPSTQWWAHRDNIKRVVFASEGGEKVVVRDCDYLLEGLRNVESVDLSGIDTSEVGSMHDMFASCSSLKAIDLSPLNTSKVNNMAYMFAGCSSLQSLDLSPLDTTNVTSMNYMFSACAALKSLDLSVLNTQAVTGIDGMFEGCSALTNVNLKSFNTSKVTNMYGVFSGCSALQAVDLSGFQTDKVLTMSYLFYGCESLLYIDMSSFNTIGVEAMDYMFEDCTSLTGIKLGTKVTKLGALPDSLLNSDKKWYSASEDRWFTIAEIVTSRLGIADSYTSFDKEGAKAYDLTGAVVTPTPTSFVYDGAEKKPTVSVQIESGIVPEWGYDVSYENNRNVGTATVTVTGKMLYSGQSSAEFTIESPPNPVDPGNPDNPDNPSNPTDDSGSGSNPNNGSGSNGGSNSGSSESSGDNPSKTKSDLATYRGKAREAQFTDLRDDDWYMKVPEGAFPDSQTLYLDYTVARGLMSGYKGDRAGQFGPCDSLSRAQTATILYRLANPESKATTDQADYEDNRTVLPDVESRRYYTAAVNWCVDQGIITGFKEGPNAGKFLPDADVSREQLATMVFRYCTYYAKQPAASVDLTMFSDCGEIGEWAREGVAYCAAKQIVGGYTDGTHRFGPSHSAERCQMAKIIAVTARMLE